MVFCCVHFADRETETGSWPEDYALCTLIAKSARRLRVSAIRKHTQIPSRPEKPLQAVLSKVCLGGRSWKRQMQTEYGGHLFLKRRKKIISCTGMFLFKKKPIRRHRTCLPALKKQGGLFQLSGAWNVCLQEHPDSCNNKHVQLQELCLTSLDNTV